MQYVRNISFNDGRGDGCSHRYRVEDHYFDMQGIFVGQGTALTTLRSMKTSIKRPVEALTSMR